MVDFCKTAATTGIDQPLMGTPGAGFEWGLGEMVVGMGYGVLDELKATNIEHCIAEAKVIACDAQQAYHEAIGNHDIGMTLYHLADAYSLAGSTMTDCKADIALDLPTIKAWASLFTLTEKEIQSTITKNVLKHMIKLTSEFTGAKKTWNHFEFYNTGEKLGHMAVQASQTKNMLYQDEIDMGIEIDFEGEPYILQ